MVMMMIMIFSIACFLSLPAFLTAQKNPGVRVDITKSGLNAAGEAIFAQLSQSLNKQSFPDESGNQKIGFLTIAYWTLTKIRPVKLEVPYNDVSPAPGTGITWYLQKGSLAIAGQYYIELLWGSNGDFDVSVDSISMCLTMAVGMDTKGRPTLHTASCSSSVGAVNIHFNGDTSWLFNTLSSLLYNKVKTSIEGMMCDVATKAIDSTAAAQLSTFKSDVVFANILQLDYSLASVPRFYSDSVQIDLKGEVFVVGKNTEALIPHPDLPTTSNSSTMVVITLSEFMPNSMLYSLHTNNLIQYVVNKDNLPLKYKDYARCICLPKIPCVGSMIPETVRDLLCNKNSTIEMLLNTTQPPMLSIAPSGINILAKGDITFMIDGEYEVLQISATINTTAIPSIDGTYIRATVEPVHIELDTALDSLNENVSVPLIFDEVIHSFVNEKLNGITSRGLQLPLINGIEFVKPLLTCQHHAVVFSSDCHSASKPAI